MVRVHVAFSSDITMCTCCSRNVALNCQTCYSKLKKITATEPQPQRKVWTVLRYLRKLHIVWSLLRRPVTRRLTGLQTMYTTFLDIAKYGEIMTKFQFNGAATEPQRNRKFRHINNDKYCRPGLQVILCVFIITKG